MTDLMAAPTRPAGHGDVAGDRYRLDDLLGRGRTSTVHAAWDERLRRRVAVRVFDTAVTAEALAVAATIWTPGMSRVLDAGTESDADGASRVFLVRDLVPGLSLTRLAASVECRAATTAALGAGVAATLSALHVRGVGHGAVHGGNIFVPAFATSPDWSHDAAAATVLTDFGLGERSPDRCDPREDVRALGTTLLAVLTGRTVVGSRTTRASLATLRKHGAAGIASRERSAWTSTLGAMTDVEPASRPSALEAAAALATLQGVLPTRL